MLTDWLSCAQDNVPAFDSSEAVAIIERNLDGKLLDKYESFTMEPIAAASLGQVRPCMSFCCTISSIYRGIANTCCKSLCMIALAFCQMRMKHCLPESLLTIYSSDICCRVIKTALF